ncbi:MAG: caspase family protein [Bacteroidales bacterium]
MKRDFLLPALLFLSVSCFSPAQIPSQPAREKRIALVIGNGTYSSGVLANPENDSRAMADALKKLGFTVLNFENLDESSMKRAIDEFGDRLKGNDVGLFYYAGHGIQAKGYNYLIPVDAHLKTEDEVDYDCVRADRVLSLMESSGTRVNIIVLDACRNNPFERSWTRSAAGNGLAFMNAPKGTLIAYATAPGSTASDGSGDHGLYTAAILQSIMIPNITIIEMFQNVRNLVSEKSDNEQIPWESTSMTGDFYFNSKNEISGNGLNNKSVSIKNENVNGARGVSNDQTNSRDNLNPASPNEGKKVMSNRVSHLFRITYSLAGRTSLSLKEPDYKNNSEHGYVIVKIFVNRNGNVVWASTGQKELTNLSAELCAAAREAALSSAFSPKPDALKIQAGIITYIYK